MYSRGYMYCPRCLNNTLRLKDHGVVHVIINNKQMDAGRFLFNTESIKKEELERDFRGKLEEFFKWYSNFQNKNPIEYVQLVTNDVVCENSCAIPLNNRFSVVGLLFPKSKVMEYLAALSKQYNIQIELKED